MKLLKLLDRRPTGKHKVRFALFICPYCGSIVEKQLSNGKRDKSCGCERYKLITKSNTLHGYSRVGSRLFGIWCKMRDRCNNPNNPDYKYYGGKGVVVNEIWSNFINFRKWALENGCSSNLQIDRVDSDGDYTPENCRWVTPKVNQRNRKIVKLNEGKVQKIRKYIAEGKSVKDISSIYGVSTYCIYDIKKGKTWN